MRISVEPHASPDMRQYAVERGCTRAWLTTFTFQAPDYYPKLGSAPFAVLEDHPLGPRHHFFQKRLPGPTAGL